MPKELYRVTLKGEPSGKVKGYLVYYDNGDAVLICNDCQNKKGQSVD